MERHLKRPNKRTFSRRIPGLVPIDGGDRIRGDVGKERRATSAEGERVGHDLAAPGALQTSDALNGNVDAPGESQLGVNGTLGPKLQIKEQFSRSTKKAA
jgi:hypothetical protein